MALDIAAIEKRAAAYVKRWELNGDNVRAEVQFARALLHILAERAELIAALEFYRDNWQTNMEGDSSTPGLSRYWMDPNDALFSDAGDRARRILARARGKMIEEP